MASSLSIASFASEGQECGTSKNVQYTERRPRITRENLCLVLALWMEECPVEVVKKPSSSELAIAEEDFDPAKNLDPANSLDIARKVGAVLVSNGFLYAIDCSRHGVHGVVRLLMKHRDKCKDSEVFVSRKPCALCTKLLVQSKVARVLYMPIEPELEDVDDLKRVDMLFKTSRVGQSVFVPRVQEEVITEAEKKKKTPVKKREKIKKELLKKYWKAEWIGRVKTVLPWPAFDENMSKKVSEDFESLMEWIARILVNSKDHTFKCSAPGTATDFFDPRKDFERRLASHYITMANFLAERTDDPKTGVGAVIIDRKMDVVALGWNGYPIKAQYGEYARASDDDPEENKKYSYLIHAEQNALLMRNAKDIADGTLFCTKIPCHECVPLLEMEGIKTVVLGTEINRKQTQGNLNYGKFEDKVKEEVFLLFTGKPNSGSGEGHDPSNTAKRQLQYDSRASIKGPKLL